MKTVFYKFVAILIAISHLILIQLNIRFIIEELHIIVDLIFFPLRNKGILKYWQYDYNRFNEHDRNFMKEFKSFSQQFIFSIAMLFILPLGLIILIPGTIQYYIKSKQNLSNYYEELLSVYYDYTEDKTWYGILMLFIQTTLVLFFTYFTDYTIISFIFMFIVFYNIILPDIYKRIQQYNKYLK